MSTRYLYTVFARAVGCLALLALSFATQASESSTALPETVKEALRKAQLPEQALGLIAYPLGQRTDSERVVRHQAEQFMQPASTLKVLTSAVGLEVLSPVYVGKVELRTDGKTAGKVLRGNLRLRGLLHSEFTLEAFEKLLLKLRRDGIEVIHGDLIVDRQIHRPPRPELGVPPFDEAPEFRYNVIPDGLSLNMNLLPLDIKSDSKGVMVSIAYGHDMSLPGIELLSDQTLNDEPCSQWANGWKIPEVEVGKTINIRLKGSFPRECRIETEINVLDRQVFVERWWRALWQRLGGRFTGRVLEANDASPINWDNWTLLASHQSRPLSELILDINKRSSNPVTRLIHAALGEHYRAQLERAGKMDSTSTTSELADLQIIQWLESKGIDSKGLVIDNGSGLSRTARISPLMLAQVLGVMYSSRWQHELQASLPIAGLDGSMRNRLKESIATQKARIKTGGLRNVTSGAGYITDASGQVWVFVAMLNHDKASGPDSRRVIDTLIEWVAQGAPL